MERFDNFVTHRGVRIAFVLFIVPGFPKDTLCYLLGLTHLRRIDFILMNILGRLPGTLVLALEGDAVRTGKYKAFFWILAASVAATVGLYVFRTYLIQAFVLLAGRLVKIIKRQ